MTFEPVRGAPLYEWPTIEFISRLETFDPGLCLFHFDWIAAILTLPAVEALFGPLEELFIADELFFDSLD